MICNIVNILFSARHNLRPFIVEKILPAFKKDWVTFCVKIGYNKNTLKIPKNGSVVNPFWQILRYWTEAVERSDEDPLKILYKSLSKVNKSLQSDMLEWIVPDILKCIKEGIVYCFNVF